ncbi:MAG: hypothetical protein WCX88_03720 [Patescibacteria group bacterium]
MKYQEYFEDFTKKIENTLDKDNLDLTDEFKIFLEEKMIKGFKEHGDGVFNKKLNDILTELSYEAVDLTGWSLIAFVIAERDNLSEEIKAEIISIAGNGFKNWLRLKKLEEKIKKI